MFRLHVSSGYFWSTHKCPTAEGGSCVQSKQRQTSARERRDCVDSRFCSAGPCPTKAAGFPKRMRDQIVPLSQSTKPPPQMYDSQPRIVFLFLFCLCCLVLSSLSTTMATHVSLIDKGNLSLTYNSRIHDVERVLVPQGDGGVISIYRISISVNTKTVLSFTCLLALRNCWIPMRGN